MAALCAAPPIARVKTNLAAAPLAPERVREIVEGLGPKAVLLFDGRYAELTNLHGEAYKSRNEAESALASICASRGLAQDVTVSILAASKNREVGRAVGLLPPVHRPVRVQPRRYHVSTPRAHVIKLRPHGLRRRARNTRDKRHGGDDSPPDVGRRAGGAAGRPVHREPAHRRSAPGPRRLRRVVPPVRAIRGPDRARDVLHRRQLRAPPVRRRVLQRDGPVIRPRSDRGRVPRRRPFVHRRVPGGGGPRDRRDLRVPPQA